MSVAAVSRGMLAECFDKCGQACGDGAEARCSLPAKTGSSPFAFGYLGFRDTEGVKADPNVSCAE